MEETFDALDCLCPMHVVINSFGLISHVGPTLQKLRSSEGLVGQRLFDVFEVSRPAHVSDIAALCAAQGRKLHLRLRAGGETTFKGVAKPFGASGSLILNLSFGIGVIDAVAEYKLSSADFAHTDLTVEMLYLVEAKSAAMEESRDLITRLQGARIAAEEQAFTDTLTGLKNRRALDHVVTRLVEQATPFALVHLDLDFFKAVNDSLGHAAGDFVLQNVAQILVHETQSADTVARIGGDEFVLILQELTDIRVIEALMTRIIHRLEEPLHFEGHPCRVSGSAGTTVSDRYLEPDLAGMLADADIALYASKDRGRGCHTVFEEDLQQGIAEGAA